MKGHLLMSRKELRRRSVLELVESNRITLLEASARMGLSYRHTLRVYNRFVLYGDAGLVHRRRDKPSNRAYPGSLREEVLRRYREVYKPHGFGPTLAAEKLAEVGLYVDHETLRRWLLAEGQWEKRRRRRAHRSHRQRRAHFGELVQMDGSHHHWFGPDHAPCCLTNMVDDATGTTMALLDHQETTEAAMTLLGRWIARYGIPMALYTDKKNVYVTDREPTLEEELAGQEPMTAFGKACYKLGIAIITAHSPQAKGRVERSNGTYQDRLVKELALRQITTLARANELLVNGFTDALNVRFAVAPVEAEDYHRPLPKALDLNTVFCHETHRILHNDWTVRHENRYYQILKDNSPLPRPKERILVRTPMGGRLQLLYREKLLAFRPISPEELREQRRAKPQPPDKPKKATRPKPARKWRPNCGLRAARLGTTP